MQQPGFWDDPEAAGRVSAQHAGLSGRLSDYRELHREVEELAELAGLAREEERAGTLDPDFLEELATGCRPGRRAPRAPRGDPAVLGPSTTRATPS